MVIGIEIATAGNIRANGLRADPSFNSIGSGAVTVEDYDASRRHVTTSRGEISLHQIVAGRLTAISRDGSVESGTDTVKLGFANGTDTL